MTATMPGSPPALPQDASAVDGWHAHIYYDPATTRARAALLRGWVAERFPDARLGHWHDLPVGPHPRAMFQIAFPPALFAAFVPWLVLNRLGLTVLLHPETEDPRADHLEHAVWCGEILPLDTSVLPASRGAPPAA